jgi:DNA primase
MKQIEQYLTTKLTASQYSGGRYLMARCPFHDDHTPSLSVTAASGAFRCFDCDARGDLAALIAKVEGVSPREAIAKARRLRAGGRHD